MSVNVKALSATARVPLDNPPANFPVVVVRDVRQGDPEFDRLKEQVYVRRPTGGLTAMSKSDIKSAPFGTSMLTLGTEDSIPED